jgi:hypothetical protein
MSAESPPPPAPPQVPPPAPHPALSRPSIEQVRAEAQQHLGFPLWLTLEHLLWLRDPAAAPQLIRACFADPLYKIPVEPLARRWTSSLLLTCERDTTYRLVALLAPELPNANLALFLTADASLLFLAQSDAARRQDGLIQLAAPDAGITVLTPEALKAQAGKAILKGDLLISLQRQTLHAVDGHDEWRAAPA